MSQKRGRVTLPFFSVYDEVKDVPVVLVGDAEVDEDAAEQRQVVDAEEVADVAE
jgi:hypothetical protein